MTTPFASITDTDLALVTGGARTKTEPPAKESAGERQKRFADKIMSQPFPSEYIPGF